MLCFVRLLNNYCLCENAAGFERSSGNDFWARIQIKGCSIVVNCDAVDFHDGIPDGKIDRREDRVMHNEPKSDGSRSGRERETGLVVRGIEL